MSQTNLSSLHVDCSLIDDSSRIRQDYSHVEDLAHSIEELGQLQPVVVTADYKLVAGGSRLRAVRDHLKRPTILAVFLETIPEDRLRLLEVEENVRRKDFTWQERVLGVARVHELKWKESILSGASTKWTQRQTGELLGFSVGHVNSALLLAELIRKPDKDIIAASSPVEAVKLLMKRKEDEATRALARMTFAPRPTDSKTVIPPAGKIEDFFTDVVSPTPSIPYGGIVIPSPANEDPVQPSGAPKAEQSEAEQGRGSAPSIPLSPILLLGDCISHMTDGTIAPESVDHIITDIPYGIDMSMLQQQNSGMDVSSTAAEHGVEGNIELMRKLLPATWTVLKPGGFFLLWYDLDHHESLQSMARELGYVVQRWPIYWVKTHPCLNQAAQYNFTKSVETCMLLRKGNGTLITPQSTNYWIGGNEDAKARFNHPFAKPTKLWQWLAKAVAAPGSLVYDPFAGVGSSTVSLLESGYRVLASELNPDHHSRLVINVATHYRRAFPDATFS